MGTVSALVSFASAALVNSEPCPSAGHYRAILMGADRPFYPDDGKTAVQLKPQQMATGERNVYMLLYVRNGGNEVIVVLIICIP